MEKIDTEAQYKIALRRVESLMSAEPGTPEFDELDRLGAIVEAYEEEHFPIEPPSEEEQEKFRLDQQGVKGVYDVTRNNEVATAIKEAVFEYLDGINMGTWTQAKQDTIDKELVEKVRRILKETKEE